MSNELLFLRGTELLQQVALGPRAIQVGSSPDCDVALDHPLVPPRAYLIEERAGTVWLYSAEYGGGVRSDVVVVPLFNLTLPHNSFVKDLLTDEKPIASYI